MEPLRSKALRVGIGAGVLAVILGFFNKGQFVESYLLGYVFCLAFAGGGLGFLLLHHLVVSRWGLVMQRPLEAAARTLPLMLVLFIPIVLGMSHLYGKWMDAAAVAADPVLSQKTLYLNRPFFLGRAAFYFAVWLGLTFFLTRWSRILDETREPADFTRIRRLSGIGLVLYVLTVTFAAFDWMMSLEPKWFSTIYGALFMIGQGLSVLCLCAIVLHKLRDREPLKGVIGPQQFHDIGNFLFAFVILWTYMGFGQFLIIWSANLYPETFWYLNRRYGGWLSISIIMTFVNFLIPFLLLLMKKNKRRSGVLAAIAVWVVASRLIDIHWNIAPTFHPSSLHVHPLDLLLPIALGGLWLNVFLKNLASAPLLPTGDPRFEACFADKDKH